MTQPTTNRRRRGFAITLALVAATLVPASLMAAPLPQTAPSPSAPVTLAGDGKTDSIAPNVFGNTMVYNDCSTNICSVWMLNFTTKQPTLVSQSGHDQINPVTDGTWVVWQDGRNAPGADPTDYTANYDLYAANLNDRQTFLVSNAPHLQGRPSIANGVVVWADYRDAKSSADPDAGDIYMFDLASKQETQITNLPSAESRPVTNGQVIVWVDFRNEPNPQGFNGDLYGYDIATRQEFPITNAPDLQTEPAIYGDTVVWQDYRNATSGDDYNADIYGYNLATKEEFAVTTSAGLQARPSVAGKLIAWEDYRNDPAQPDANGSINFTNGDIYGYDLATRREFPVYLGAGMQGAPSVGGNTVAFESNPDPTDQAQYWSILGVTVNGVQGGTITPIAPPTALPGTGSTTFPETGKTTTGIFLDYWNAHGGLAQQGYPISDVIGEISDLDGQPYTVQYFERAVFEYHPEQSDPQYQVLLSQLGTFQYKRKYPNGAPDQKPNQTNGILFQETGHWVGGKFLDYWQSHGGLAQQGYPISDEFTEVSDLNGQPYTMQYFERAVFEYHSENEAPNNVLLSQLGTFQHKARYGGK
jgi:beta propeller repeat protein